MENTMVTRREWLRSSLAGSAAVLVSNRFAEAAVSFAPIAITVYKTPACGCCKGWVKHLEANGFAVTAHDMPSVDEVKKTQRVPRSARILPHGDRWSLHDRRPRTGRCHQADAARKARDPRARRGWNADGFSRHGRRTERVVRSDRIRAQWQDARLRKR
jgi:hypothetical protein